MTPRFAVRSVFAAAAIAVILSVSGAPAGAQDREPAKQSTLAVLPVHIEVTMSRYQGEKKVSSMPYLLMAKAEDVRVQPGPHNTVSLRMGVDVPVGTTTSSRASTTPNGGTTSTQSVDYRNVGTNIDCYAERLDETHFNVNVNITDSSVYSPDGANKSLKVDDPTAFRTLTTRNSATFRDGQTILFGTATDKVTGEVLKIEVTLTVVK